MTDTMPRERRCSICRGPHRAQINALRLSGMNYSQIAAALAGMGVKMKRDTISAHFTICLNGNAPTIDQATGMELINGAKNAKSQGEYDFATMVQRRAIAMMEAGTLPINATHGLQAQALLDRRAEKQADRELSFNIARLLSGSIAMPPVEIIEGRARDVTALTDGLAPPALVETT